MSRDKLSDYAFLYQTHDGHDGSKVSTCTTLCRPVSLKCPEISSLTLRFCLKTLRFCNGTLVSAVFCSGASVAPQLCLSSVLPPVSLKCPEISSLTLRFCLKNMMDIMAQRCLLVQLYVIQFLSNVPR